MRSEELSPNANSLLKHQEHHFKNLLVSDAEDRPTSAIIKIITSTDEISSKLCFPRFSMEILHLAAEEIMFCF